MYHKLHWRKLLVDFVLANGIIRPKRDKNGTPSTVIGPNTTRPIILTSPFLQWNYFKLATVDGSIVHSMIFRTKCDCYFQWSNRFSNEIISENIRKMKMKNRKRVKEKEDKEKQLHHTIKSLKRVKLVSQKDGFFPFGLLSYWNDFIAQRYFSFLFFWLFFFSHELSWAISSQIIIFSSSNKQKKCSQNVFILIVAPYFFFHHMYLVWYFNTIRRLLLNYYLLSFFRLFVRADREKKKSTRNWYTRIEPNFECSNYYNYVSNLYITTLSKHGLHWNFPAFARPYFSAFDSSMTHQFAKEQTHTNKNIPNCNLDDSMIVWSIWNFLLQWYFIQMTWTMCFFSLLSASVKQG